MTPPTDARPGETTCAECGKQKGEHYHDGLDFYCHNVFDWKNYENLPKFAPLSPPAARGAEATEVLCPCVCLTPCKASCHCADPFRDGECLRCDGTGLLAAHPEPAPAPDAALREAAQGIITALEAWDVILDCESATDAPVIAAIQSLRAALAQDGGR